MVAFLPGSLSTASCSNPVNVCGRWESWLIPSQLKHSWVSLGLLHLHKSSYHYFTPKQLQRHPPPHTHSRNSFVFIESQPYFFSRNLGTPLNYFCDFFGVVKGGEKDEATGKKRRFMFKTVLFVMLYDRSRKTTPFHYPQDPSKIPISCHCTGWVDLLVSRWENWINFMLDLHWGHGLHFLAHT
jgi:hypothetical protein